MPRPRRRMFGPFFYVTATVAVLLAACVQIQSCAPMFADWLRERSLLRELQADDARQREAALSTLVRNGSTKILPYIFAAAHDSRSAQRVLACRYLIAAGTKPEDAVPILVAAASDADPTVRFEVASAFRRLVRGAVFDKAQLMSTKLSTSAVDVRTVSIAALRRLLKDQTGTTRVVAAEALGYFALDAGAAADLATATGDNEREVRLAAAQALLRVNGSSDPTAARTLLTLVADPEPVADRRAVLDVVLSAGNTELEAQTAVALGRLLGAEDISTHADVMDCLVTMGPKARAALPAIERQLDDADPVQRASAAVALASIDGKSTRVIQRLLAIVADLSVPVDWRQAALGKIQEVDEVKVALATPILIQQLAAQNVEARENAIDMLRGIVSERPAQLPAPSAAQ